MPSPCLAQRGEEGLGEEAEPSSPLCPSRASRARACSMGLGVYLKECILRRTLFSLPSLKEGSSSFFPGREDLSSFSLLYIFLLSFSPFWGEASFLSFLPEDALFSLFFSGGVFLWNILLVL